MNSEIRLDGTARSPEDAVALHDLGLQFTEIPINDEASFLPFKAAYWILKDELSLYYLCHGPQEGTPMKS